MNIVPGRLCGGNAHGWRKLPIEEANTNRKKGRVNKKGHRSTMRAVIDMFEQRYGDTVLVLLKDYIAGMCAYTDDLQDVEFIDVETGRDNPHKKSCPTRTTSRPSSTAAARSPRSTTSSTSAGVRASSTTTTATTTPRVPGTWASTRRRLELASECDEEFVAWITGYKVDEGIMFWFNDEYVHAPVRQVVQ